MFDTLAAMCQRDPDSRIGGFSGVDQTIRNKQFYEADFDDADLAAYREFADAISWHITKIESGAKYVNDMPKLLAQLNDVYQRFMLEETVPDAAVVLRCLVTGMFTTTRKKGLSVRIVRDFVRLLRATVDRAF